jgi:hypothetical protein
MAVQGGSQPGEEEEHGDFFSCEEAEDARGAAGLSTQSKGRCMARNEVMFT